MASMTVLYDLSPFVSYQKEFHSALSGHITNRTAVPIVEILSLLPVRFKSNADRERLLTRGNGKFELVGDAYVNSAMSDTQVAFDDYMLGEIRTTLPNAMEFVPGAPGALIELQARGSRVLVASIENLNLPGDVIATPPFSVEGFQVGSESMITRIKDSRGIDIVIDGRVRSNFSISSGGMDEFCEKDWVMLQDSTSRRCIIQRSENPVRRYPVVGYYDSKDEALRATRSNGCNGVTVVE